MSQFVRERQVTELSAIAALLSYLTPSPDRPIYYIDEPPEGTPRDNASYETRTLTIQNARLLQRDFDIDREGFKLIEHSSRVHDFYDPDEIYRVYYPEAEQLLVRATGAAKAVVFDHNLRNADLVRQQQPGIREPVTRVHNDFTAKSGYSRGLLELTARGINNPEALLKGRFSIINLWRPIAEPVQSYPLAVCDARSIAPDDLIARDLIYRDRVGETYAITYNSAHQWYYFPQMRRNEVLLLKCFDSDGDRARFTAHTAFDDPTASPDAPARESIELRALAFYD